MSKYQPGQRWTYRARECDANSTLLIGKVQKRLLRQTIIHIAVIGVRRDSSADPTDIGHMPFSLKAIDASVLELKESAIAISPNFDEGFNTWIANKGGVFDIPVSKAVDIVLSAIKPDAVDPFDALVRTMRAEKSEAMIQKLYKQLFSLDQWYFLCCPDNSRAPAEWVFPDGLNKTPALLAFTSQPRAASAAVTLGIYPEGSAVSVMPASVKDAVDWVNGAGCTNTWICFNLTFEDFPLYCDHAQKLLNGASGN